MHNVLLETDRLLLKGYSPEAMNVIFTTLPKAEVMHLLGHKSDDDYEKEAYKQRNGYASYNRSFLLFLLTHKSTGHIPGRCGFHNWNAEHHRAEVGYVMHEEDFKRQGLMTEALGAIIRHGFHTMNLHRVEALVGSHNTASLRLMEKFRFVREGLLRQHYFINSIYEDSVLFSLLREEYTAG